MRPGYRLAGTLGQALSGDGDELLRHLVIDRLVKVAIVLVALVVLALGMAIIWRITGRDR